MLKHDRDLMLRALSALENPSRLPDGEIGRLIVDLRRATTKRLAKKLNQPIADHIRAELLAGRAGGAELAARYGVSEANIGLIENNCIWVGTDPYAR